MTVLTGPAAAGPVNLSRVQDKLSDFPGPPQVTPRVTNDNGLQVLTHVMVCNVFLQKPNDLIYDPLTDCVGVIQAEIGKHVTLNQRVTGSSPVSPTIFGMGGYRKITSPPPAKSPLLPAPPPGICPKSIPSAAYTPLRTPPAPARNRPAPDISRKA